MTLVEMMVGVAVGLLVMLVVVVTAVTSSHNFAALGNYRGLNQTSRVTLDRMTKEIRQAANLSSFSTNKLVFIWSGSTNLTYTFDAAAKKLIRSKTGEADKNLLIQCDYFEFSMFKSAPQVGGSFVKTTLPLEGKVIGINWRCSRTILGKACNTEDVTSALIVIRNKPTS